VTPSVLLIAFLASLYFLAMLFLWHNARGQEQEPTPSTQVRFVLTEGQTILGVMDKIGTMYFCIGKIENRVHTDEEAV
jgi:hypothetical protein